MDYMLYYGGELMLEFQMAHKGVYDARKRPPERVEKHVVSLQFVGPTYLDLFDVCQRDERVREFIAENWRALYLRPYHANWTDEEMEWTVHGLDETESTFHGFRDDLHDFDQAELVLIAGQLREMRRGTLPPEFEFTGYDPARPLLWLRNEKQTFYPLYPVTQNNKPGAPTAAAVVAVDASVAVTTTAEATAAKTIKEEEKKEGVSPAQTPTKRTIMTKRTASSAKRSKKRAADADDEDD